MNNTTSSLAEQVSSGPERLLPERLFRSLAWIAVVGIAVVGGVIGFIFLETV